MFHVVLTHGLFFLSTCRPSVVEDDLRGLFASSGATVKAFKFFQLVSLLFTLFTLSALLSFLTYATFRRDQTLQQKTQGISFIFIGVVHKTTKKGPAKKLSQNQLFRKRNPMSWLPIT